MAISLGAIFATLSRAQTNSCISSVDGFWHDSSLWSLATAPGIAQSAIFITNDASETVTIDSNTANNFSSTLTISNLSVAAPFGSIDTLYLDNTGGIALHILNGLTIGIIDYPATGGGALISTNSTLIVDGLEGGQLVDDGTMIIAGGTLITTNCSLLVAPQPNSFFNPTGLLIVSNANVQARDVFVANPAFDGSSGTMQVIGCTMTLSSSLTVGDYGGSGGVGNLLVADGSLLVVTNGTAGIIHGSLTVTNASFLGDGLFLGSLRSGGALAINNGTVTLSGWLNLGVSGMSFGDVNLNGGMLVVTNNAINIGGYPGNGDLTVSDGILLGQAIFIAEDGVLSIQGGTSILSSSLSLSIGSTVYISGGQLVVTNGSLSMDGGFGGAGAQCVVAGGLLEANDIELGESFAAGTLSVNGGSVTASTGITLGDCASAGVGYVTVDGGQLIVTNAAGTGFIDVRNGELNLSCGVLQVDKLVMTNSCSSFVHTGGTLIAGSVLLDPNAFAITSIVREGNDFRVTWLMAPGATNALQASGGGTNGSYITSGFTDIFVVTNNTTPRMLTNYLDIGAATNKPSRFYRARLAP